MARIMPLRWMLQIGVRWSIDEGEALNALGDGVKRIEENEEKSLIVQRRCLRNRSSLKVGDILQEDDDCCHKAAC